MADDDRFKKNQDLRTKIIDHLLTDGEGNFSIPIDKDTLTMVDKFMTSQDKVEMHKDRINTDKDNADANREVAKAIAANTSTVTLRTRHDAPPPSSSGPRAIGSERNTSINPDTITPCGGDIDIDQITRDGRAATKGQDPDSLE